MKDYWLAKFISSVSMIDSRKRLQKSIFLLQFAGCPLKCDYILHYYGPYSFELAGLIDQLKGAEIIKESTETTGYGNMRYISNVTSKGKHILDNFEKSDIGRKTSAQIQKYVPLFERLNTEDLWILELAATIAYFYKGDWQQAQHQTAKFKKVAIDSSAIKKAVKLAKEFNKSA